MKIVKIDDDIATVELDGVERTANLMMLEGARVGDYVLIHAGFAIQKIDPAEAEKTINLIREIADKTAQEQNTRPEPDL